MRLTERLIRDVFVALLREVAWVEDTDQARAWPQRGKLRNYLRHPDLSRSALFPHGASAINSAMVLQRISALIMKAGIAALFVDSRRAH